jgi:hypothetical protein
MEDYGFDLQTVRGSYLIAVWHRVPKLDACFSRVQGPLSQALDDTIGKAYPCLSSNMCACAWL